MLHTSKIILSSVVVLLQVCQAGICVEDGQSAAVDRLLAEAMHLADQGYYDQAERVYQEAIDVVSHRSEIYSGLAWLIFDRADFDTLDGEGYRKMKAYFKKSVELDPRNADGLSGLGRIHQIQFQDDVDLELSKKFFKEALAVDPDTYRAYVGLGWLAFQEGKLDAARAMFEQAVRLRASNIDGWRGLGWALWSLGFYQEAEAAFIKMISINPQSPKGFVNLGLIKIYKKEYDEAAQYFRKATTLGGDFACPHEGLGLLYLKTKHYKTAMAEFNKVIKQNPRLFEPVFYLAMIHYKQGSMRKAREGFLEALKIEPRRDVYIMLGWLCVDSRRSREAEEYFIKAAAIDYGGLPALYSLGWFYLMAGRYDEAGGIFSRMLERSAGHADAMVGLACVYARQRRAEDAQKIFCSIFEDARPLRSGALLHLEEFDVFEEVYPKVEAALKKMTTETKDDAYLLRRALSLTTLRKNSLHGVKKSSFEEKPVRSDVNI